LTNVHLLILMMVVLLDLTLFMMLKNMDFVLVVKKDSLIVQIVDIMIITVVIVKMLLFVVEILHYQKNHMLDLMVNGLVCLNLTSLNFLKMDKGLMVLSYFTVMNTSGELCVMTT
jgi:hypothetical protein